MGKKQKFTEDQLLSAVIKFSEVERGKIKATDLANWCRKNYPGLEEVRDYHFTRPIYEKDAKTGKNIERAKLCALKIDEINRSRRLVRNMDTNLLLRASSIDTFMEQSDLTKRKMIASTRETVDQLLSSNRDIARENEAVKVENKELKSQISGLSEKIESLQKAQAKLSKQVAYVMKIADETMQKKMLADMGIEDETIDLQKYINSLQQELNDVMNINSVLLRYMSGEMQVEPVTSDLELEGMGEGSATTEDTEDNITSTILSGIDF